MNDLTEKLKLSKIPNAEVGERIKVVIYSFVHLYVLTIVIGQTLKNLIDTPLKTQKIEWHGLMQEPQKWTKSLSSEQQKMTKNCAIHKDFSTIKYSLRIPINSANPKAMQTFSAPILQEPSINHIIQEPTRPANPQLDFTGGSAKWRFDNSKLQKLTN